MGEYAAAKTAVWWDIENCAVPRNCDPHLIVQNMSSALATAGYVGPISVSAYGDTSGIAHNVQHALSSTGVSLHHVPAGTVPPPPPRPSFSQIPNHTPLCSSYLIARAVVVRSPLANACGLRRFDGWYTRWICRRYSRMIVES
uniref:NYN domain-containing protein n=1 Tax=Aegilops tauschii subsp. strangulata TaxID=200361 RepID=A0A453AZ18_AEGTS